MRKKRIKSLLLLTIVYLYSFAQTEGYRFRADIRPVNETGFYNILLTPQLNAHLKTDFSDLRIVNSSGKWVPHLLRNPATEQTHQMALWDLSITKNVGDNNSSEIIISSPHQKISNLHFFLRNTSVERFGNLTGSEDSTNWFIINDSVQLKPVPSDLSGESEFVINFPPNNYRLYKLSITNKAKAPYAISKVGSSYLIIETGTDQSLWQPVLNPAGTITQKDSGKISYITVVQKAAFHSNRIQLSFSGLKYFNRLVELYIPPSGKQSIHLPGRFVTSFSISNNSSLLFNVPLFNDSVFYLLIHNEDNLPLRAETIKTYSGPQVATVYLEKNSQYTVILGNASATLPNYDLKATDIDLRKALPVAVTGDTKEIQNNKAVVDSPWYKTRLMLWLAIVAAASVLTFFTFRLIKDMGKSKDSIS